MRSVDESEIGSAKVLPPEELRLSWWQNFFYVAGSLTTSRETQRRSVGSSTNCSRHFLLSEGRSACVLLLGLDITSVIVHSDVNSGDETWALAVDY
jgi:hypothetical protein